MTLRLIIRSLARRPGISLLGILSVAVGIAVVGAVFTLTYNLLWRPLPIVSPERLASLYHVYPKLGLEHADVSPPSLAIYRAQTNVFQTVTAIAPETVMNLTGGVEPEQVQVQPVARDFFQTLGVNLWRGRGFLAEEDDPAHSLVTVLSYRLWSSRFGARDSVIGEKVEINGVGFSVVGVAPPELRVYGDPDLWTPLALRPFQVAATQHGNEFLTVIARLKDNISWHEAETAISVLSAQVRRDYPKYYPESSGWHIGITPVRDDMLGQGRPALLALGASVILVYLIVGFDFAILMILSAFSRAREITTRLALGSSFRNIATQFAAEGVVLAVAGGTAGIYLAQLCLKLVLSRAPLPQTWLPAGLAPDWRVLLFSVALTVVTGFTFGFFAVWRARTRNLAGALSQAANTHSQSSERARLLRLLVALQVCLSTVLLLGAGVLIRSFRELQRVDLGFQTEQVSSLRIILPRSRYPDQNSAAVLTRIVQELSDQSPTPKTGIVSDLPLQMSGRGVLFTIQDRPLSPGTMAPQAAFRLVSPGLFDALAIPLLRGRGFDDRDAETGMPVIVLDQAAAERFWPGEDPLGKHIGLGYESRDGQPRWREVVGIVGRIHSVSADQDPGPTLYIPVNQATVFRSGYLLARSSAPQSVLNQQIATAVKRVDPELPVAPIVGMNSVLSKSMAARRSSMVVVSLFASVALALAALGIFGVLSYTVAMRIRELAIRIALGAQRERLFKLVLSDALLLVAVGALAGSAVFVMVYRVVARFAFGVSPLDPLTFSATWLTFAIVALFSALLPAWRATHVAPAEALRFD